MRSFVVLGALLRPAFTTEAQPRGVFLGLEFARLKPSVLPIPVRLVSSRARFRTPSRGGFDSRVVILSAAAASRAKELAGLNGTAAKDRPRAVEAGYFRKINSSCFNLHLPQVLGERD